MQCGQGGAREGAGRKPHLKDPRRLLIILEPEQVRILKKLAKQLKDRGTFRTVAGQPRLPSRSEVLRHLLTEYQFD